MKKAFYLFLCFFVSFCITFYLTFPYKVLYQYWLNKVSKNKDLAYYIETAGLFSVKVTKIIFQVKEKRINIDYIYAKWNPIYFLLKKKFFQLEIHKEESKAIFFCKRQNDNFVITGDVPIKFIQHFFKDYQILKILKKDIFILVRLNYKKGQINLNSIQITGDFVLKGEAYIKNHFFVFNGKLEYQNFKKNISYYLKI